MLASRLQGRRIEVLDARTETSTLWANPDGTMSLEASTAPVRFKRDGKWVAVDTTLVIDPDGALRAKAHPKDLKLASARGTGGGTDLITLGSGGSKVTLGWNGNLPQPSLDGSKATYPAALPGADLVVEATRTGFEQYLVLKDRAAATQAKSLVMPLRADGLTARKNADDSVTFTDRVSGEVVGSLPAPVMWDATRKRGRDKARTAPVDLEVKQTGDVVTLRLTPDAAFLNAPGTVFPVTVDPAVYLGPNFDTTVQQDITTDQSASTELAIGQYGYQQAARSFLHFPEADAVEGKQIVKAELNLFAAWSDTCAPRGWEVWDTGLASVDSRWANQPQWRSKVATSTATFGNSSTCKSEWVHADITSLVSKWSTQTNAANAIGIRATDESDPTGYKTFLSGDASWGGPSLLVTYNGPPPTPATQILPSTPGTVRYTSTATPELTSTAVDSDGVGQVAVELELSSQAGLLKTVTRSATNGTAVTATVGDFGLTRLDAGVRYSYRSRVSDGSAQSSWSSPLAFEVDTTAPSAPTVTSTDYPSAQWVKGAGQAGVFTVTPPTGEQSSVDWSTDGISWTSVPTSGSANPVTITVTPGKAGTHTLLVRSGDRADNKSEATAYTFHAGVGGFLAPSAGERTARHFPLAVETDATRFDAVTFSWRRSEADPWAPVPVADVRVAGQPLAAWPTALANGRNSALTWHATDTVNPDGAVELKADFTGPGGAAGSSETIRVVVDRSASGAASTEVGPGTVNLLTGDHVLSSTDVSAFDVEIRRTASSLRPTAGAQEGQAAIFGKEWASGTFAEVGKSQFSHLRKVSPTALDLVDIDGEAIHFTAKQGGTGWIPEPGAESLVLTGAFTGTFKLSTDYGTVITFAKPQASSTTWQLTSVLRDGLENSGTRVVSETVTVEGATLARPKRVIAPTTAVPAATCEADPAVRGCRVLEFGYAQATTANGTTLGDVAGQVNEIRLWATTPGAASSTATVMARYAYDVNGRLSEAWDPRIAPALKTTYSYDTAGRVRELTPAGQLPYTFVYGNASSTSANDGMLLKVSRPGLQAGSSDQTAGTGTTSLVYSVPLTGAGAPHPMGASDVALWGQSDAPTDATAVFPADVVPASHNGGGLSATSYTRAGLHYLNASGRLVNAVDAAKNVTTAEYDRNGNTVRALSAANRAIALGGTAADRTTLAELGIVALPAAERADLLSAHSRFSSDGSRELEKTGPLQQVQLTQDLKDGGSTLLPAGSVVAARARTVLEYDQGRPTDGTAVVKDQPTTLTSGAEVRKYPHLLADPRTTVTSYNWALGVPTSTVLDPAGLALTKSAEYDAQGRLVKSLLPTSNGTDAAARVNTYYSATGTGPCSGRPEWADLVCSVGPAGAITGGGSNPQNAVLKTTEYGRFGQVTRVSEAANGTTRTTDTTFDTAARPVRTVVSGGIGEPVAASNTTYDPASGQIVKTAADGGATITKAFDRLGRQISYTDGSGATTTTEYDLLGRPTKVSDAVPSTVVYTYDSAKEPRGMATAVTDSVAGTFTAVHDIDGSVREETLPGGYTLRQGRDTTGATRSRTYTRDSDSAVLLADSAVRSVYGQILTRTKVSGPAMTLAYRYDTVGRLTAADETLQGICTRRTYTLDKNANRTSRTTATGTGTGVCPAAADSTSTHRYDSADRIVDAGYGYDAFGRTTALPDGTTLTYHVSDQVRSQSTGTTRQTWTLDPADRLGSWTVDTNTGTWTQTAAKTNHYADDSDNPRWITESTGALTRNVTALEGALAATTTKTGGTVLQLTDLHSDIAVQLPLDQGQAPTVLHNDEFGNPRAGQAASRYNWLGGAQRSTETPSGVILMGARLYSPATGRFLSVDPVAGGGANDYVYCSGDGVNCSDTTGLLDYAFNFNLGYSRVYVNNVFAHFMWNFGRIFPLAGRAQRITRECQTMDLRDSIAWFKIVNFNVSVGQIGVRHLRLYARQGSIVYGRNSYINFTLNQNWNGRVGYMTLNIHGHTEGDTWADRWIPKSIYKDGAYSTWSRLAANLRNFLGELHRYYGV
ncbi:DNRLRE domain-containing protein [Kitasatospora sp. NPDC051853]|uniref:DNRLRE domain-containing protein n=1 Tax=Kitasatospora sp. NPDC051853 TaxID=3364058 RepID=UPI0037BA8D94